MIPVITGEVTHEIAIGTKPATNGKSGMDFVQTTPFTPL